MTQAGPPKLPRSLRTATLICLMLSAIVGFISAGESRSLVHFSELREARIFRLPGIGETAALDAGLIRALQPMRTSRAITLAALSIACAFSFVAAGRLLYPSGLSRENMRRLLVGSLLVVALLRTIEGAQWAVVMRRVAGEMGKAFVTFSGNREQLPEEQVRHLIPPLALGAAIFQTLLVVGTFVLFSHYFRSARVQQMVASTSRD